MKAINTMSGLQEEITRLKVLKFHQETALQLHWKELEETFQPINLVKKGINSLFRYSQEDRPVYMSIISAILEAAANAILLKNPALMQKAGETVTNLILKLIMHFAPYLKNEVTETVHEKEMKH